MSDGCAAIRRELGAFIDGELGGIAMLRVSHHLDECGECAEHVESFRAIGDALRRSRPVDPPKPVFDGLVGRVVGRNRAEVAFAWRTRLLHACEDWHWAIVGGGSVAATFTTTTLLLLVLAFGPAPHRPDSVSGMWGNLGSPAGPMFVYASAIGQDAGVPVLMQVENGWPPVSPMAAALAVSSAYVDQREADLVNELATAVTRDGRVLRLEAMHPAARRRTEALLDQLMSLRTAQPVSVGSGLQILEVRYVTSTGVTAKRL